MAPAASLLLCLSLSLLQLCLGFCSFTDMFPHFWTGWTEMLASFLPVHVVATCFISSCLSRWWTSISSPVRWRLAPLSVHHTNQKEKWAREKGEGFSRLPFLKRQLHTKKANQPKLTTKLTNNQTKPFAPTSKMNCYLELSLFLLWLLVPQCFFNAFSFCFLELFLLRASQAWLRGSRQPTEGRKNSLAMYKKEQVKPKMLFLMSFLYCSLVSFFVTVIIWWRFPNCTKLHGN